MNELLYRRVDVEDVVAAHLLALERAAAIGFGRYVISATTPFTVDDRDELRTNAPAVVRRLMPHYEEIYARRGWSMFPAIDRVDVNDLAGRELGWGRGTTSHARWRVPPRAKTTAVRWRARSARTAITRRCSPTIRMPSPGPMLDPISIATRRSPQGAASPSAPVTYTAR